MRGACWEDKNPAAATAFAYAGISRALRDAEEHAEQPDELRSLAKMMAYDLASFTWPGWDEEGIVTGPNDTAAGFDAARTNLTWALELEKGDLPDCRAHWMLGAQLLAAHQFGKALDSFQSSAHAARRAGAEAGACLALVRSAQPAPRRRGESVRRPRSGNGGAGGSARRRGFCRTGRSGEEGIRGRSPLTLE